MPQNTAGKSAPLTHEEIARYSRHLIMPEVGMEGQAKLKAASVLIIGTGGLGSPAAMYLAAAGVGRIGLVDYDVVDASNLQRQIIHGAKDTGRPKTDSARDRLTDINPMIRIDTYPAPLTSKNALDIITPYDAVVDGTDNFPTRYLLNDACVMLGKPYVYGSIMRFEGQVSVFDASHGPCYRCLFPTPPPPGTVPNCSDAGVLGVLPGVIGTLQATEAVKVLLGIGAPLIGRLLLYDALKMSFEMIKLRKRPNCPVCSETPTLTRLIDYEEFCGVPAHDHSAYAVKEAPPVQGISVQELAAMFRDGRDFILLDVREPHEWQISDLPGATHHIPEAEVMQHSEELNSGKDVIVYCRTGVRSARVVEALKKHGIACAHNLNGGINAWATEVDPSISAY